MWSNWNPHMLLVEGQVVQPLWQVLKKLSTGLPHDPAILLPGIHPRECLRMFTKGREKNVCSSTLCKSPKLKTAHVSTNYGIDQYILARSCIWILPRNKNEWTTSACKNMNGSHKILSHRRQAQETMQPDSIYVKSKNEQKSLMGVEARRVATLEGLALGTSICLLTDLSLSVSTL